MIVIIQAVLKKKGVELKLARTCTLYCLICCISIYGCMCFNKSLHLFPILLAKSNEIK